MLAQVELRGWLSTKGLSENMAEAFNKGGTIDADGIKVTLTHANHSSSGFDGGTFVYLGESCGLVIELESGFKLYVAGDTNVFGDMALIARIYEPDLVVLPIGDHFTMGPREAAVGARAPRRETLRPLPLRHLPPAHRHAGALRQLAPGVEIEAPAPGGSVEL